jgi:hypothetical protein
VISCIAPNSLGTRAEFEREWCAGHRGEVVSDPKALGQHLRAEGIMLRRTRADVGRELPPIQSIPYTVEADPEALDAISDRMAELARIILTQGGLAKGEKLRASEEISWRLRQATGIAKAPYVAAFVRLLVQSGERVVLYGWHREVYSIWLERLRDLNPVLYTGSESAAQKEASKAAFVSGESKVLIISLRAGAGWTGCSTPAGRGSSASSTGRPACTSSAAGASRGTARRTPSRCTSSSPIPGRTRSSPTCSA